METIRDFEATNLFETIDLTGITFAPAIMNYTSLLGSGAVTTVGADVLIDTGGGDGIVLTWVNIADLDNADFLF
jgi:hypothetical protein